MDLLSFISLATPATVAVCFCLYFTLSILVIRSPALPGLTTLTVCALVLHAMVIYPYWQSDTPLPPAAYWLMAAWLGALALALRPFLFGAADWQAIGWPYVAAAAAMPLELIPLESISPAQPALGIHLLLVVLALALLGQSGILALLVAAQEHQLHNRRPGWSLRWLPALGDMEKLLFHAVLLGFFLLSLGLATGFSFPRELVTKPQVFNKMLLSLGAWFIFGVLLWGRWSRGWRGSLAAYWTWGGCLVLAGAYYASRG